LPAPAIANSGDGGPTINAQFAVRASTFKEQKLSRCQLGHRALSRRIYPLSLWREKLGWSVNAMNRLHGWICRSEKWRRTLGERLP
jgi:hypothetical protein